MHKTQTTLYPQDDEDDLLADDLDDLIAEVNDSPSLKEFSSKKSKRDTDSYGYCNNTPGNSCSPLRIWEDTATEGDGEQGEENLLDFGSFTDIHNHNNINTSSFEEHMINKSIEYPEQQQQQQSSKAILVVQAICSEQQGYMKRGMCVKKSDEKENVNPNWKQSKINYTERRQVTFSSNKERIGLRDRKIQKANDKNIMKVEKLNENIKEEFSKRWMNPEKEVVNGRILSNGKQKIFGVERLQGKGTNNLYLNCNNNSSSSNNDSLQQRNNRMYGNNTYNPQLSNHSDYANSVQHFNEQLQSNTSSGFMDGCVKRMSKLELEKMRFQAQLEEERKKQINCLNGQVLKFDF